MSVYRHAALLTLCLVAGLICGPAAAQTVDLGLIQNGSLTGRAAQLFALVTVLSLAPGIAIMVTCFPFMVTVLSLLRQAIGLQQAPPSMMIVTLALFLTYFVMEPVFTQAWKDGVQPLMNGDVTEAQAFALTMAPFRVFMESRVSPDTVQVLINAAPGHPALVPGQATPLSILLPSFLLSEIQRGFEVGFLIFLPFLVIDLVIASVLMSMGMMMVPPAIVSLPFKLAFFVVVNGWTLLAGALVRGYAT